MQFIRTKSSRERFKILLTGVIESIKTKKDSIYHLNNYMHDKNISFNFKKALLELENVKINVNFDKIFPYHLIAAAEELCFGFAIANEMNIHIVHPYKDLRFITGDQPIVNIHVDYNNIDNLIPDNEFFYLLSPKIGIILNNSKHEVWQKNLSKVKTLLLNSKINDAAFLQVFAIDASDFPL